MTPPETWRFEDEQDDLMPNEGCDYGLSEFCVDLFALDTGCTVNCGLYMESVRAMNKPTINYKFCKILGMIVMILLGAWMVFVIPSGQPLNTSLNTFIVALGIATMLLVSALENRGEF